MKIKAKTTRLAFTPEEKEGYYNWVKKSHTVQRNKKKFHRPTEKRKEF